MSPTRFSHHLKVYHDTYISTHLFLQRHSRLPLGNRMHLWEIRSHRPYCFRPRILVAKKAHRQRSGNVFGNEQLVLLSPPSHASRQPRDYTGTVGLGSRRSISRASATKEMTCVQRPAARLKRLALASHGRQNRGKGRVLTLPFLRRTDAFASRGPVANRFGSSCGSGNTVKIYDLFFGAAK